MFIIPFNAPPSGGSFLASPTTGTALSTKFSFTAPSWVDSNLPLSYQFSILIPPKNTPITNIQAFPFTSSYLPAQTPNQTYTIAVKVWDFYKASSSAFGNVTVIHSAQTMGNVVSNILSFLSATATSDPVTSAIEANIATM